MSEPSAAIWSVSMVRVSFPNFLAFVYVDLANCAPPWHEIFGHAALFGEISHCRFFTAVLGDRKKTEENHHESDQQPAGDLQRERLERCDFAPLTLYALKIDRFLAKQ